MTAEFQMGIGEPGQVVRHGAASAARRGSMIGDKDELRIIDALSDRITIP